MSTNLLRRGVLVVPALSILVMVLLSAILGPGLPAQVPMHWLINGAVDGYGTPTQAMVLTPALTLAVVVLLRLVRALERRRGPLADALDQLVIGVTAYLAVVHATLLWMGPVPLVAGVGIVGVLIFGVLVRQRQVNQPPPPFRRRASDLRAER